MLTECPTCGGTTCICFPPISEEHLRKKLFKLAIEIIKNEYPEEQWPDYEIPLMEKCLSRWV